MWGKRDRSEGSLFSPERIKNLQISDPLSLYLKKTTTKTEKK